MSETIQPTNENKNKMNDVTGEQAPNATSVLVLGILSIIFCWCWGLGLILGIIALIFGVKSRRLVLEEPDRYSIASQKNLNAGYICALIGTILGGLFVLSTVISIIFGLALGTSIFQYLPWDDIFNNM